MNLEELITTASLGYPENLILASFNGEDIGDSLAEFICDELEETFCDESDENQIKQACKVLQTAADEINAVIAVLKKGGPGETHSD